ncbi:NTF2 fold immunity protein [Mucilaginibacter angelicae]|uniref:NTF2 fold immunity protein n=1 Tax=Mucilaginibacter angelicae TaxID=869718 RepID=A0ABV6L8E2_9SPHI
MNKKVSIGLSTLILFLILGFCISCRSKSTKPPADLDNGLVQDEEAAKKIAEAIWLQFYGDAIYDEKPFVATLNGNIWTVTGTLHEIHGGAAIIRFQKSDCKIITFAHGK